MKLDKIMIGLAAAAALVAAGFGIYQAGMRQGMEAGGVASTDAPATPVDPSAWGIAEGEAATRRHIKEGLRAGALDLVTGRSILYYHDPMVPGKKFEAPGKSPFMDMMLVPAYGGSTGADAGNVSVSSRVRQNFGLRTAPVTEAVLASAVSAVGVIGWNERDQVLVQARALSHVEKLHVRAAFDHVDKGQALLDLFVPDWVAAQEEFLSVRRMQGTSLAGLEDAARARMRQAGMLEEQIRLVEASGRVQARITMRAPIAGIVSELMVREGMTMAAGATAARINGLGTVWADAEVPESQVALLRTGDQVVIRSAALPDVSFDGRLLSLLSEVNSVTRTRKARVQLTNPDGRLVPGMVVQMQFSNRRTKKSLQVPTEAIIHTGKRSLVMLAEEGGFFRPLEVVSGVEAGGQTEIRQGLRAGQRVVVSGQFLIDSEASLAGILARLGPADSAPVAVKTDLHRARARIEALAGAGLTLTHPPIASLKWPAMTMDFKLAPDVVRSALRAGQEIDIEFRMQDGEPPLIVGIRPATAVTGAVK